MRIKNISGIEIKKGIMIYPDKRLSIPVMDIKLLCTYSNKLTYLKNGLYLQLLPTKINNLKELKNLLIRFMKLYPVMNKSDNDFMNIIRESSALIYDILYNDNDNLEMSNRLKYGVKFIEKRINYYQKQLAHKKPIEKFKINTYDLIQLSDKILTDNVKKLIYFYLIKLRKMKISYTTSIYLRHKVINDIIQDYNNSLIVNDLEEYLNKELSLFSNNFLNKTI